MMNSVHISDISNSYKKNPITIENKLAQAIMESYKSVSRLISKQVHLSTLELLPQTRASAVNNP